jgi:hypothetical protein
MKHGDLDLAYLGQLSWLHHLRFYGFSVEMAWRGFEELSSPCRQAFSVGAFEKLSHAASVAPRAFGDVESVFDSAAGEDCHFWDGSL